MAYDYAAEREEADATLKEDGAAILLRHTPPGVVNGGTGEVTPGVTVEVPTYGLLKAYRSSEIDGSTVVRGDLKCLSSAQQLFLQGQTPAAGWTCTIGTTVYRVMDAEAVATGGIPFLYRLQLRK